MPNFPENKHFLRPDTHTYVRLLTLGLFACSVRILIEGFQMYNGTPCLSQFANAVAWQTATINEKLWTCSKKPGKDWNMVKNKKLQPLAIIIAIRKTSLISFKGRVCMWYADLQSSPRAHKNKICISGREDVCSSVF